MIEARVDKAESEISMEGDLRTITAEFLLLTWEVYNGVKEAGEIPAQLFRKRVIDMIGVCFQQDAEIIKAEHDELEKAQKLITRIEEIIKVFPKEA